MPHAYLPLAQGRGIERGGDVRLVLQIAVASTIVSLHSVARRLPPPWCTQLETCGVAPVEFRR